MLKGIYLARLLLGNISENSISQSLGGFLGVCPRRFDPRLNLLKYTSGSNVNLLKENKIWKRPEIDKNVIFKWEILTRVCLQVVN